MVTLSINPPPSDRKCECCRRHISELKAFGGVGDPLVGDFTGAKLIKTFYAMIYKCEEYDIILREIEEISKKPDGTYPDYFENLIKKVGKEQAKNLMFYDQLLNTVEAVWICRDCAILNYKDFYEKRDKSYAKEQENNNNLI